jgi:DNA polymerase-1
LLKRRRYFDFGSANSFVMASYLRESVNSVFQGSAADLIKLSMVKLYNKYQGNNKVKMLLQIHDELIFEVDENIVEETAKDIQDIMQNIYKLNVPLQTSITISNRWGSI